MESTTIREMTVNIALTTPPASGITSPPALHRTERRPRFCMRTDAHECWAIQHVDENFVPRGSLTVIDVSGPPMVMVFPEGINIEHSMHISEIDQALAGLMDELDLVDFEEDPDNDNDDFISVSLPPLKTYAVKASEVNLPMDDVCSICQENHGKCDTIRTSCDHIFGQPCFLQWVSTQHKKHSVLCCPLCRTENPSYHGFRPRKPYVRKVHPPVSENVLTPKLRSSTKHLLVDVKK